MCGRIGNPRQAWPGRCPAVASFEAAELGHCSWKSRWRMLLTIAPKRATATCPRSRVHNGPVCSDSAPMAEWPRLTVVRIAPRGWQHTEARFPRNALRLVSGGPSDRAGIACAAAGQLQLFRCGGGKFEGQCRCDCCQMGCVNLQPKTFSRAPASLALDCRSTLAWCS